MTLRKETEAALADVAGGLDCECHAYSVVQCWKECQSLGRECVAASCCDYRALRAAIEDDRRTYAEAAVAEALRKEGT